MRTEELLEQCLQALSSGQELPADVARYLARHPEKRAEVEDLLFIAQRTSRLPSAELKADRRAAMQERLASRLGFDAEALNPPTQPEPIAASLVEDEHVEDEGRRARRPLLSIGKVSIARLRYAPPPTDDEASNRIRAAFNDLTADDIRRYIGIRGEDYLYYRQRFPGWEPIFALIAIVLRGFKHLEKLTNF
jgi:hypothetical protein